MARGIHPLFLASAWLVGLLSALPLAANTPAFFNGKDLSQWETAGKAEWRVEDGVIVGGQDGDPKRSGILIRKASTQP